MKFDFLFLVSILYFGKKMTNPISHNNKVGPFRGGANKNAKTYWDRMFTIEEFALLARSPISMLKKAVLEKGQINGKSVPPIHSISSSGKMSFRGADIKIFVEAQETEYRKLVDPLSR